MEHHIHHHTILDKRKEMRGFYHSLFLRSVAVRLIGIFGAVYLLTVGFSLELVLLFLAVSMVAITPASPIVGKITQKFGLKHTVIAAPFISICYYVMLCVLKSYPNTTLLFTAAIVGAFGSTFFWIPMNSHFAHNCETKGIAKQVAYRKFLTKFPKIIGPIIASAIILYLGFPILFLVAGLLYLSSVFPLLKTKDYKLPLKRRINSFLARKNARLSLFFFVKGLYSVVGSTFLPLYIYLQTNSFVATGVIASLIGVGVVAGTLLIGHISDKVGKHRTMKVAATIATIAWILVFFASGFWLYVLSVLVGFVSMSMSITIMAIYCQNLTPSMSEDYMIHREMWLGVGNGLLPLLILAFLGFGFELAFIIAAISALFFVFYEI